MESAVYQIDSNLSTDNSLIMVMAAFNLPMQYRGPECHGIQLAELAATELVVKKLAITWHSHYSRVV